MTSRTWAGTDPVDGLTPGVPAGPARGAGTPAAATEGQGSWADLDGAVRSIGDQALKMNLRRARNLDEAVTLAGLGRLEDGRRLIAVEAAHQLVGSAGTFGFREASVRAGELERFFLQADFDEPQVTLASDWVTDLLAELAAEPDY